MSKPAEPTVSRIESTVKSCYSTWGTTYFEEYYGDKAPYPPVHLDLVRRLVDEAAPSRVLDAGCGPASMLRTLTAPGRALYGFDLTPEMTAEARRVMAPLGVSGAVVCCGVLPHIPAEMDTTVIANVHAALKPGGLAIVEARNELFSLFTLNRYTHEFFRNNLLPLQMLRDKAGAEQQGLDAALSEVESMFRTDLPPIRKGKAGEPGYDEVLSRSHNPLLLERQFQAAGFRDSRLMYYHFHCLPPMVARHAPELFKTASVAMEENPEDWRGLLMASAFFVVARRN